MNFWDSSALVPLLIEQTQSQWVEEHYQKESRGIFVWWGTLTECISAIARLERDKMLLDHEAEHAFKATTALAKNWNEILPSDLVREKANRLLKIHSLRTGDAFQLAAAIVASEDFASKVAFVTLDARLASAARKEGFGVLEK